MAFSSPLVKPFLFCSSLALLALGLGGCSPSTNPAANNEVALNSATNAGTANAASSGLGNEAANSAVISAMPSGSGQTPPVAALASVWVPGQDDLLHIKPVSKAALDEQKKFKNPVSALNDLVRMAPNYFPPKTRVLDWHDNGPTVSINLNRNFADSTFWSKRGDSRTRLAVYALVNSTANSARTAKPVVLEVEKKPVQTVGEMDAEGSIEPNLQLQAKPGMDTSGSTGANASGTGQGQP